jgi:1,4-dihydroxy-2-naphthoyl-CoA hydrolase
MSIWKTQATVEDINLRGKGLASDHIGIVFTEIGDDYIKAEMPITDKVKQPLGIMNGGISCLIAESVGSTAANIAVDITKQYCVGLDINTNHVRPVSKGKVTAVAKPFHIGRTTHVWSIEIFGDHGKLISVNRLTMAVKDRS